MSYRLKVTLAVTFVILLGAYCGNLYLQWPPANPLRFVLVLNRTPDHGYSKNLSTMKVDVLNTCHVPVRVPYVMLHPAGSARRLATMEPRSFYALSGSALDADGLLRPQARGHFLFYVNTSDLPADLSTLRVDYYYMGRAEMQFKRFCSALRNILPAPMQGWVPDPEHERGRASLEVEMQAESP
ncbi:hypothetical protein DES53_11593 [Roseimicrobium gellanilyticum]|uniref:Uncharacterized protein n=1 Tax=Roseimicrobium gellanilyticum TaxID=748857 RepID=A0A366H5N7_9BACT|nr:hypothetical protein [Roseimicrobium gellanilyticum]RBP36952.1 hypothetical protein DES53_11593 [Roseimicrobium gellanilyticum]